MTSSNRTRRIVFENEVDIYAADFAWLTKHQANVAALCEKLDSELRAANAHLLDVERQRIRMADLEQAA